MVGAYRLSELGYALPSGAHLLPAEAFAPVPAATGLLRAAEDRAAGIVADAEEAHRRRSQEGYQEGLERARVESFERLLGESAALDASLEAVEAELAQVVALCVRRLVAEFDDYARARSVVRGALKQMRREKRAELRVPPALHGRFRAGIGEIAAEFPEVELVDVVEDPTLADSQVVLETRIGRVEADVAGRAAELEEAIRGVAARRREPAEGSA